MVWVKYDYLLNLLDNDVDLKIFYEEFGLYIFKIRECIMKLVYVFFNVIINIFY